MKIQNHSIDTNLEFDGKEFDIEVGSSFIHGCYWTPQINPKFIYIYFHDINLFMLFNKDINNMMLEYAGAVFSTDHYGHGSSPGLRSDGSIEQLTQEIIALIKYAQGIFPNIPIFIHGHSLGALATLYASYTNPEFFVKNVSGIILESPLITQNPNNSTFFGNTYIALMNYIFPTKYISYDVENSLEMSISYTDLYSKSIYAEQSICHHATARFLFSIYQAMAFVRMNPHLCSKKIPMIILHGSEDQVLDFMEINGWIDDLFQQSEDMPIKYFFYEMGNHCLTKSNLVYHTILKDMLEFIDSCFTNKTK